VIRGVCPAYAAISNLSVGFNGTGGNAAPFNIITSAGNNTRQGQKFEVCRGRGIMARLIDEDTATDSATSFSVPYPAPDHEDGDPVTVAEFIDLY